MPASHRSFTRQIAFAGALLVALVTLGSLTAAPRPAASEEESPKPEQVRQGVERSLSFLQRSSEAWRANRKCVSCHQVPFTLWAENEARARGFQVEAAKVADLSRWAFDFCATDVYQGQATGGFLLTMADLALAHQPAPAEEWELRTYPVLAPIIARYQRPDGSWKEGNHVGLAGAEREGIEVDTMWAVLALMAMECRPLDEKTRSTLVASRERALAWLGEGQPGQRTDWVALRMLLDSERGQADRAAALRRELVTRQNPDGGWPFAKGGESLPHVTGECLYALARAGGKDEAAVSRGARYLLVGQRADGSWEALSRQALGAGKPRKVNEITVHWGTAWAALGLLQTLPRR